MSHVEEHSLEEIKAKSVQLNELVKSLRGRL